MLIPTGPNQYDGRWHVQHFCAYCDARVSYVQKMCGGGCCPNCGHIDAGTVLETNKRAVRWVKAPRKWWQIWRILDGEFVGK